MTCIYHVCHMFTPQFLYICEDICKEQICANPFFWPVFHPGVINEINLHVSWLAN